MIIFDLDGTLWETVETTYEAANTITKKYKQLLPISRQTVKNGMGLSSKENAKNYMPYLKQDESMKYLKEISQLNFRLIQEKGANIYEGVIDTIKELSKTKKLGIITNSHDEYVQNFLNITKLEHYFTDYMGAASYNITKGEAIKKMVEKHKDKKNYYVGDIKKDKEASEYANVEFIHAKYGFEPTLKAKLHINKITELPEILKKSNK
jgi:phosphoglycolate phosphatase